MGVEVHRGGDISRLLEELVFFLSVKKSCFLKLLIALFRVCVCRGGGGCSENVKLILPNFQGGCSFCRTGAKKTSL